MKRGSFFVARFGQGTRQRVAVRMLAIFVITALKTVITKSRFSAEAPINSQITVVFRAKSAMHGPEIARNGTVS